MASSIGKGLFNKFNRGEVSKDAFAREDVTRIDNSCELMENFTPERLGPMSFRPGTETLDNSPGSITHTVDDETLLVPFPTSLDDPAMLLFAAAAGNPELDFIRGNTYEFFERALTTTTWLEGNFDTPLGTGWTDADVGGAVSSISGFRLLMTGTGTDEAKVWQTSSTTENGVPHGFLFQVDKGQVLCQIGTGGVDSADLFEAFLEIGIHHIEIDPGNDDITVTLSNANIRQGRMIFAELLGDTTLALSLESALQKAIVNTSQVAYQVVRSLRWAQSADVLYFCGGQDPLTFQQGWIPFEVRRHNATSFSVQRYVNVFGPYETINIGNVTMEPQGVIDGNMTVAPSRPYFEASPPGMGFGNNDFGYGVLLKLAVNGQIQAVSGISAGTATQGVFVFGTGDARTFNYDVQTTGAYTRIELQKSFDEITWQLVPGGDFTGGGDLNNVAFNDGLDGAEIFYRLELVTPGATSDLDMQISYAYGTLESQGRTVENDNNQDVEIEWYVPFNGPISTEYPDWFIGSWGGKFVMPSAVALHEGRLWFAGGNRIWGSESDFYESFDTLLEGASASIKKTIGFGAAQRIHWLAPSARLVAATAISEIDVRSSTFGEVLTALNTNLKAGSDIGTADIVPIVLDNEILFVQRGANKLIGIDFSLNTEKHAVEDFNMLNSEILRQGGGVIQIVFARNPETRVYAVMADGTMRVLLRDITEGILGWSRITIRNNLGVQDDVVSVAVLPSEDEDEVWITTAGPRNAVMKFAPFNLAQGGLDSRHHDSFQYFASPGSTTLTMNGTFFNTWVVAAWVDGVDVGDFTISGNQITGVTGADVAANVTVGFRYEATYLSNKLTDFANISVVAQRKRIINTGLLMRNYVQGGVTVGYDLNNLAPMPTVEDGKAVVAGTEEYDHFPFPYNGTSETDPRIAIKATAPVKMLAYVYDVKDTASKTPTKQGQ
jgi:hypothetical protein